MAKSDTAAPVVSESAAPKFKLEALRTHRLKLFGVEASTFDGATYGLDPAGEYTVAEIKDTIERWGKKEAK